MDQNGEVHDFRGALFFGPPEHSQTNLKIKMRALPAHFDLGFIGQLSKLTFRPTVDVHRVM